MKLDIHSKHLLVQPLVFLTDRYFNQLLNTETTLNECSDVSNDT